MNVLRLVATSTARDGTISGPVVVLTPGGAVGARDMPKCRQALADALALSLTGSVGSARS